MVYAAARDDTIGKRGMVHIQIIIMPAMFVHTIGTCAHVQIKRHAVCDTISTR